MPSTVMAKGMEIPFNRFATGISPDGMVSVYPEDQGNSRSCKIFCS
jgi:hypothetical protein